MLHKPDAAYLTQTGRGYLQVGNDEVYEQFQSGWSGAVYDAEGGSSKNGAVLLDLQGREMVSGRRSKGEKKKKAMQKWMTEIVTVIADFCEKMQIRDLSDCTREERRALAKQVIGELNCKEERFPENASNLHIMEEIIHYLPQEVDGPEEAADYLIEVFQENIKKLPEAERDHAAGCRGTLSWRAGREKSLHQQTETVDAGASKTACDHRTAWL